MASIAFIVFCYRSKINDSYPINLKVIIPFNLSLLLIMPFLLIEMAFGNSDIFAIATTLKSINTSSLISIALSDFFDLILEGIILWFIFSASSIYLISRIEYFSYILIILTLFFIILNPITIPIVKSSFSDPQDKLDLVSDFQGVKINQRMNSKKNLVHIYLESVERSYSKIQETKSSFEYFSELEKQGLSFTNIDQVYGTHFTAAGIVASQCGVPLLPNGIFDYRNKIHENTERSFDNQDDQFMSGIVCLGDILKQEDYFLSYMNGSSLEIFSKGKIFLSHGYDRVFGINTLADSANESRQNKWGLDDSYIFEKAKNELEELSKIGKPFALTMLTIGTHGPDAFLDNSCEDFLVAESYIPAAIECTANHVKSLLDKIESLGIMDDTIVVIQSDHLAMRNTIYSQLKALGREHRRNYLVILGANQKQEINTLSTPFDIYPTILEVMGFKPNARSANLGTSMLSSNDKLADIYGIQMISSSLKNNVKLQKLLWAED